MNDLTERIGEIVYLVTEKHLTGQHDQKRHGWRYGGVDAARRSMRGRGAEERGEYRKRAGMPVPTKIPKQDPKGLNANLSEKDLDGFSKGKFNIILDGKATGMEGYTKGDFGVYGDKYDATITHIPTGFSVPLRPRSLDEAKLLVSSLIKNGILDEIKDKSFAEKFTISKETLGRFADFQDKVGRKSADVARSIREKTREEKRQAAERRAEEFEKAPLYVPPSKPYHKGSMNFAPGSVTSMPNDSKGFVQAKFELMRPNYEKFAVKGEVKGNYGIHKDNGMYTISHLPSGVVVLRTENRKAALNLAGAMDRVLPNMRVFLESIKSISNDDITTMNNFFDSFGGFGEMKKYFGIE